MIVAAVLAVILAGFVKGVVGLGFPPIATALIGAVLDSRTAVITVALPSMILNAVQAWQGRGALHHMKRLGPLLVALVPGSVAGAYLFTALPIDATSVLLGMAIMTYALLSLFRLDPRIPECLLVGVGIGVGFVGGLLGGATGMHAPLLALYMSATNLRKDEFPAAMSFILLLAQLPQIATYAIVGLMTAERLSLAIAMIPSAMIGLIFGSAVRLRISQDTFAAAVRVALVVIGAKLIRDGLGLIALDF